MKKMYTNVSMVESNSLLCKWKMWEGGHSRPPQTLQEGRALLSQQRYATLNSDIDRIDDARIFVQADLGIPTQALLTRGNLLRGGRIGGREIYRAKTDGHEATTVQFRSMPAQQTRGVHVPIFSASEKGAGKWLSTTAQSRDNLFRLTVERQTSCPSCTRLNSTLKSRSLAAIITSTGCLPTAPSCFVLTQSPSFPCVP